jgi:hypothetical protein
MQSWIWFWLNIGDLAERHFEYWMRQADVEPHAVLRVLQEEIAADAVLLANAARAEADGLLWELLTNRSSVGPSGVSGGGWPIGPVVTLILSCSRVSAQW